MTDRFTVFRPRYDASFWDASFRLVVGGETLSPTSNLNMIVPGNSLRYAMVTFRVPLASTVATLRIENGDAHAAIPLDLSPTGRSPTRCALGYRCASKIAGAIRSTAGR